MYRILLVEDDPGIAQAVCAHLRQWELDARCVQNFRAVMEEFTAFDPQLVLLDISLPFFNGYHWCTQIRAVSKVPIIFISSASDNMNIVINGITKRQTRKCNMKEIENAIISYLKSNGNFFSKVIIKTIRFSKSNLDKDNKLKELTSKFNCQRFMVWTGDGNQAIECYIERTE